jgi:hypothetical protein
MPQVSLTDYGSQLAEIQRRQKLADILTQQAEQPIEIQSYKGTQAPIPWTAVLAKALQGYAGTWEARKAAGHEDQLRQRTAQAFNQALNIQFGDPSSSVAAPIAAPPPPDMQAQFSPEALTGIPPAGPRPEPMQPPQAVQPQPMPQGPQAPPVAPPDATPAPPVAQATPPPPSPRKMKALQDYQKALALQAQFAGTPYAAQAGTMVQSAKEQVQKISDLEDAAAQKEQERMADVTRAKALVPALNLPPEIAPAAAAIAEARGTAGLEPMITAVTQNALKPKERYATPEEKQKAGIPQDVVIKVNELTGDPSVVYDGHAAKISEENLKARWADVGLSKARLGIEYQNLALAKQRAGTPDPQTINFLAEKYLATGKLDSMGMGGAVLKQAVLAAAAQKAQAAGLSGTQAAGNAAKFNATSGAYRNLTTQAEKVKSFEDTAIRNADLALSLAPKGAGPLKSPILNQWVQTGRKAVLGDPGVTQFDAALGTFLDEYAKVTSGSMGAAATTDSARKEAYDRLSKFANQGQLSAGIATMKKDMANRTAGFDSRLSKMEGDMAVTLNPTIKPGAAKPDPLGIR